MDVRTRTRSKFVPVVGSLTAAATTVGALAAVAQVAPAGAEQGGASLALGTAGVTGAGTFEACSAYFGFGKDESVLGVVEFDVADVNGDDDVAHAVDVDTDVRLVLENPEGDVLECVPVEVTEEQWSDTFDDDPNLPPFPGPGHYVYPSVNLDPEIEDFGQVVEVGFRVTGIPGEHTLVSPEAVKDLAAMYLNPEETVDGELIDQRVLDLIEAEANAEAAAAYEAALDGCDEDADPADGSDADLLAAVHVLEELIGDDEDATDVDCFDVDFLHAIASFFLSAFESVDYVEEIRLSVPEPAPTPPAPAAQPAAAAPQFTG